MIIIAATLDFGSESERNKAVELTAPIQLATREDEEGCVSYCFAPDPSVPYRIQVYELWDNEPSLVAHFSQKNYANMVEALNSVGIRDTENQMYLIDQHKSVYDKEGNPRKVLFAND